MFNFKLKSLMRKDGIYVKKKTFTLRKPLILLTMVISTNAFTSCGSLSQVVNDPYFQEGFKQGWNATVDDEYKIK